MNSNDFLLKIHLPFIKDSIKKLAWEIERELKHSKNLKASMAKAQALWPQILAASMVKAPAAWFQMGIQSEHPITHANYLTKKILTASNVI